jgi:hypothetical protein
MDDWDKSNEPSAATMHRLMVAVERAYHNPWLLMWRSFLQGFMAALGATIGTALFFTILFYVFQALGGVTLLEPFMKSLQDLIIPREFRDPGLINDAINVR